MSRTRAPRGIKPHYFADPATDKLLQIVIALAGELSVTRDRLDLIERLAARRGLFEAGDLEAFDLSQAETAEREANRAEFIARILRALQQELAEIADPRAKGFDELVRELGRTAQ
jgi:hypothetical protein